MDVHQTGAAGQSVTLTNTGNGTDTTNSTEATGGAGTANSGGAGGAASARTTTNLSPGAFLSAKATATATGGAGGSNSVGRGGAGGAATGASAVSYSSGGAAYSYAHEVGGVGGESFFSGQNGGDGGNVANTTARATGFNAKAVAVQTGGAGGATDQSNAALIGNGVGGAGASSTLVNAVTGATTGGYLTLSQTANGGAGGANNLVYLGPFFNPSTGRTYRTSSYAHGGIGGQGGAGTSYLNFNDTTNPIAAASLSGYSRANGGAGGTATGSGSSYGFGGAGTATIVLTGANLVRATAAATGGAGGKASFGGGNASANALAVATSLGSMGTATAVADATGGVGLTNGRANANATAVTANGQLADATSYISGSGASEQSSATTNGTGVLTQIIVVAQNQAGGPDTTQAEAAITGSTFGFNTSYASGAYATGLPSSAFVDSTLASGEANVATLLGGNAAEVFGAGWQEGYALSNVTLENTSSETYTINASSMSGELYAGLLTSSTNGAGFTSLAFSILVNGTQVVGQNFGSVAAAQGYFSNNALDLGAVTPSSDLTITVRYDLVSSTANSGFGVAYLLGATPLVPCFFPGTRIATPEGLRPVETLVAGDLVLTTDGDARPVRWLGRSTVAQRFHDKLRVLPIRIRAGALGAGVPTRDLLVSPDHAVYLCGVLVQAGALVNGVSVVREWMVPEVFTYYHLELDAHALIWAEGAAAETFIDNVDRMVFDNWDEHPGADGEAMAELPYARAKSARQVPGVARALMQARMAVVAQGERRIA